VVQVRFVLREGRGGAAERECAAGRQRVQEAAPLAPSPLSLAWNRCRELVAAAMSIIQGRQARIAAKTSNCVLPLPRAFTQMDVA